MSQTLSVNEVTLKHYNLSITVRDNGESSQILEELAYRTIGAWLWIAARLEQGLYTIPDELTGTVEARYAADLSSDDTDGTKKTFEFAQTFGDSRVTVWDSYRGSKRINFHLNSDDDFQSAVNTWLAAQNATKRAFEKWGDVDSKVQHAAQSSQNAPATNSTPDERATPKSQNAPQNTDRTYYTKNEAIEKLQVGDQFNMKIVQIKKRSKDDQPYFEFYSKYGSNIGKFPEITLYADNEVAVKSGLIADLDAFGLKAGESKTGEWVLRCNVGKPKVEGDKTYGRVYAETLATA